MQTTSRPIGNALIYLATEVEDEIENDFNHWTKGHLKDNLCLPGFLAARRLRRHAPDSGGSSQPTYLTLYDLADLAAIEELSNSRRDRSMPAAFSGRFRFARSLFRVLGSVPGGPSREPRGRAVLHITVEVEPAYNEAFLDWYVGEHVPAMLSAPGMVGVRRFENASVDAAGRLGEGEFRYLTLYEMEDASVVSRPETIEAAVRSACPAALEPHRRSTHEVYEEFVTMEA